MTPNSFRQSKENLVSVLGSSSRLILREHLPNPSAAKIAPASALPSKEEYMNVYQQIQDNRAYDLLLTDESIFQFGHGKGPDGTEVMRYVFMQSFRRFVPFEKSAIYDDVTEESEEEFRELYYQSEECYVNNHFPFYLRYDYNEHTCRGRLHPCSHLHFVLPDAGRIALRIQLNPFTFTMFCLKIAYRDVWEQMILSEELKSQIDRARGSCKRIQAKHWTDEDADLFLT